MPKPRRRIMRTFKMHEISAVDTPAQSPALVSIMKRDAAGDEIGLEKVDVEELKKSGDLVNLFTGLADGHQHGISIFIEERHEPIEVPEDMRDHVHGQPMRVIERPGFVVHYARSGDPDAEQHDHQITRTADGDFIVSANNGHTHSIDKEEVLAAIDAVILRKSKDEKKDDEDDDSEATSAAADESETKKADTSQNKEISMTEKTEKAEVSVEDRLAALEAENATLKAVGELSVEHRAHYDALDAELDADVRAEFLGKSAEERDELVKAASEEAEVEKAAEEVVEEGEAEVLFKSVDGEEYTKNDDPRLVAMAKALDEQKKEAIRLEKAAADAELTKRAEGDLENFPGELSVKKAILKAVDGIEDEGVREEAVAALKAQNTKLAKAFEVVGAEGEPTVVVAKSAAKEEAEAELDRLAKAKAEAEDGMDYFKAYELVSEENPELLGKAIAG